ncbi:MAG: hypothetical protein CVV49_11025 [Spirochaetae bacterium HGW-Spirochaetae-5]|nr:MAG: hypothetical protein CVV49_11025 [Spirochaetae bacterium HGW-Spirochaetae-5]
MRLFNVYACDAYRASEDEHVHPLHVYEYVHDRILFLREDDYDADHHVCENEYARFHDGDDDVHVFQT